MSFNNVLVSCVKYALDNMDLKEYENIELIDKASKKQDKEGK